MNSRERVMKALDHEQPDRVPIDLGSTSVSALTKGAYAKLKDYLGIEAAAEPGPSLVKWEEIVNPPEELLQRFQVDTYMLAPNPPENWQDIEYPNDSYQDEWGVLWKRSPAGWYYGVERNPFAGEPTLNDLRTHRWPDPHDPGRTRGLREKARHLREKTDYAIVGYINAYFLIQSQFLRGYEGWLADLLLDPEFAGALMDKVLEINLEMIDHFLGEVGEYVDVVYTSDDLATQTQLMFSPATYRKLIKPRQRTLFEFIKARTEARLLYHSDGSVYPVLNDLIEIGVDILNPIQASAKDMETDRLEKEFGDKICFWGAIDTQEVLPFGTIQQVENEVKKRIADLAPGGGYVLAPAQTIAPDVPPENICAMFDAALKYGGY
jgi:uroporphyrinogen decarboxylase